MRQDQSLTEVLKHALAVVGLAELKGGHAHVRANVPAEALRRVHAPVGIEIGALTAEEIAISIVSELVSVRRGMERSVHHKSDSAAAVHRKSE